MDAKIHPDAIQYPEMRAVVEKLILLLSPRQIYLYNQRVGESGRTTGFKLCVIAEFSDKQTAEQDAYLAIDCDVPFDLLFYTPQEWSELIGREGSFAGRIHATGTIVYG